MKFFWRKKPPVQPESPLGLSELANKDHYRLCGTIGAEPRPFSFDSVEFVSSQVCLKSGFQAFKAAYCVAENSLKEWRKANPHTRAFLVVGPVVNTDLKEDPCGDFLVMQLRGYKI